MSRKIQGSSIRDKQRDGIAVDYSRQSSIFTLTEYRELTTVQWLLVENEA
jgi:hypothetical protein